MNPTMVRKRTDRFFLFSIERLIVGHRLSEPIHRDTG